MYLAGGAGAAGLIALALGVATPEIVSFEGQKNKAYRDVVGVLTVCAGHTGPGIDPKKTYTDEECDQLTRGDVREHMEGVISVSPHLVYHPMQLAAAVSFTYNVGVGTYKKSTVAKRFNEGDFIGACNFLTRYVYAGGKVYRGLVKRREREKEICLSTLTAEGVRYAQALG